MINELEEKLRDNLFINIRMRIIEFNRMSSYHLLKHLEVYQNRVEKDRYTSGLYKGYRKYYSLEGMLSESRYKIKKGSDDLHARDYIDLRALKRIFHKTILWD